ncbi:MAG TPA: tetratricopeptide repeat protein [Casimicrobiaceae bacterium]|jgi:tetratricopeptide (TPR) repeat protein
MPNPLKRQWFRPGAGVERIAKLPTSRFLLRRTPDASHAPLRITRVAESAGAVFSTVLSVVLVVALLALVVALVREFRRDAFVLDGFSAPKDLVDNGYTSAVIGQRLLDEIHRIEHAVSASRDRPVVDAGTAQADIQVTSAGVSVRSIARYARQMLGLPENRLRGEIVREGVALRMTVRDGQPEPDRTLETLQKDGDAGALIRRAAQDVLRLSRPDTMLDYLYMTELEEKRFPRTLALIDRILTNPTPDDDEKAVRMLAGIRLAQGKADEAIALYRDAAVRWPESSRVRAGLVTALYWSGRVDEANALVPRSAPDASLSSLELTSRAKALSELNRYDEAREHAIAALRNDRANADAWTQLANAEYYLHRYTDALATAETFIKDHPGLDVVDFRWFVIGALARLDRGPEALAIAERLVATHPENPYPIAARAMALAAVGRHAEAVRDHERTAPLFATQSEPSLRWGYSLLALGRVDEALARMQDSTRRDPWWGEGHAGVGRVLTLQRKPAEALAHFETARRLDVHDPDALRNWAQALDALGRGKEADEKRALADAVARENRAAPPAILALRR